MKSRVLIVALAGLVTFLPGCETSVSPQQLAKLESAVAVTSGLVEGQRINVAAALAKAEEAKRIAEQTQAEADKAAASKLEALAASQIQVLNASEAALATAQAMVEDARDGVIDTAGAAAGAATGIGAAVGGPWGAGIGLAGALVGIWQKRKSVKLDAILAAATGALNDMAETVKYVNDLGVQAPGNESKVHLSEFKKLISDNLDDPNAKSLLSDGVMYNGTKLPS